MSDDSRIEQAIWAALDQVPIPTCPTLLARLMEEASRDRPDFDALERLLSRDVALVAVTLLVANSAVAAGDSVDNIAAALAVLGPHHLLNLATAATIRGGAVAADSTLPEFWRRSAARSTAADLLLRIVPDLPVQDVRTAAVLQDCGMPLLMRRFADYGQLAGQAWRLGDGMVTSEDRRFCTDHATIGALAARRWGVPEHVRLVIRHHHDIPYLTAAARYRDVDLSLAAATRVIDLALTAGVIGVDPRQQAADDWAVDYLGFNDTDLADLRQEVRNELYNLGLLQN